VNGVIDLNADVGEVDDPQMLETVLLGSVTSANIAAGAHAGSPAVMDAAVDFAMRSGVRVGAHPSYPDRVGFGRRVIEMSPAALRAELLAQTGALDAIARSHGIRVSHIKPHGALYHRTVADDECAKVVAEVTSVFEGAALVVPAGATFPFAERFGVRTLGEAFADRGYRPDGGLVARGEPGDLHARPEEAADQAVSIARDGRVRAVDGSWVRIEADTICLHGDTPGAAEIGLAVRAALENAGLQVCAPL
jgi:5-oxoprolinase (ATP-hydrolysing) subunit A